MQNNIVKFKSFLTTIAFTFDCNYKEMFVLVVSPDLKSGFERYQISSQASYLNCYLENSGINIEIRKVNNDSLSIHFELHDWSKREDKKLKIQHYITKKSEVDLFNRFLDNFKNPDCSLKSSNLK